MNVVGLLTPLPYGFVAATYDATSVVVTFINILSTVLVIAIIIRALMSWVMPNDGTGLSRVLVDVTEPILAPIRRVLPPVGGIDFSPILAMILIQLVGRLLAGILSNSVG